MKIDKASSFKKKKKKGNRKEKNDEVDESWIRFMKHCKFLNLKRPKPFVRMYWSDVEFYMMFLSIFA